VQGFAALAVALVVQSPSDSWMRNGKLATFVWDVSQLAPWLPGTSLPVRVGILAAWTAVSLLLLLALTQRILLRLLLSDKTFLTNARNPTLWLKVWGLLVKMLTFRRPLLYSFQGSLPSLPVPDLKETVAKYVESARQLQTEAEFAETKKLAAEFLANEGPRLQWYLKLKSWFYSNYVTDW
jgi:hypothetical protein